MNADVEAMFSSYKPTSGRQDTSGLVPIELPLLIYVNGRELVTLMCSPIKLEQLTVGFLYLSGVISRREDIILLDISPADGTADVEITPSDRLESTFSRRRRLTSGCGGGLSLDDLTSARPVEDKSTLTPMNISSAIRSTIDHASVYNTAGGVHTSALFLRGEMAAVAEDIGRHNTIDKIAGECLLNGIDSTGGWLATTGRLSSEMTSKAAALRIPVVISRSSPTSLALELAERSSVTVIGYARGRNFRAYTNQWRIDWGEDKSTDGSNTSEPHTPSN